MAYRLVIARGHAAGQQIVAGQRELHIGSGDENDLVLSDEGVSRAHLLIVERAGACLASDVGSRNGTLLNGAALTQPTALKTGDSLGVGLALLQFVRLETAAEVEAAGAALQPVPPTGHRPQGRAHDCESRPLERAPASGGRTEPAPEGALASARAAGQRPTFAPLLGGARAVPMASQTPDSVTERSAPGLAGDGPTRVRAPRAIVEGPTEPRAATALPVDGRTDRGAAQPKASERAAQARRRRRAAGTTLGRQLWFFAGQVRARVRVALVGAAVLGLGLWASWWWPARGPTLPPEPSVLRVDEVVGFSFGLGEGVDYPRPDLKQFSFTVAGPTEVAVVVHLQARALGHDEVAVSCNGAEVGFLPPDVGRPDRDLEVLLSPSVVERNATNTLVFDQVQNPPAQKAWRISRLSLELVPVPELTREQALIAAGEWVERATALEKQSALGDDSAFRAWRAWREAWVALLVFPEAQRPGLFAQARHRAGALQQQLDQRCGTLLLDVRKQLELKNPERAKALLDEVPRQFPTRDHRCQQLALEKLEEYQL